MHLAPQTLIFIGLICLLGIVGQWGGDALRPLWQYPALMLLVLLLVEWLLVRRLPLNIRLDLPDRLYLGRSMPLVIAIENPFHYPLGLQLYIQTPAAVRIGQRRDDWLLAPQASERHEHNINAELLGEHPWPTLVMRARGRFGLAWWQRKDPRSEVVEVIPEVLGNNAQRVAGSVIVGEKMKKLSGGGGEFLKLREYRRGDPLRAVDWKASARSPRLMVREYNEDQHLEIIIAIDVGRTSGIESGTLSRLGHYVNIAARFAEYAMLNNDHVGLMTFADVPLRSIRPERGFKGLQAIRNGIDGLKTLPRESNPLSAVLQLRRMISHRCLVVLLTDLDDSDAAGQLANAARLLIPKHLPLIASLRDTDVEALEQAGAREWMDPYRSFAAVEGRHAIETNILRLQRLGGQVVYAAPELLENAVLDTYDRLRSRRMV